MSKTNGNGKWPLPEGWRWSTIEELSSRITKGSTPTSYGYSYKDDGIKFVKTENIEQNGEIRRIVQYVDAETNDFFTRSKLDKDDILFSIAGTIGRVGMVRSSDLPANTNQALAIVRSIQNVISNRYLFYYLKSPYIQSLAQSKVVGVGRANLSLTELKGFIVPLAPLSEQHRIVAEIEKQFTRLDAAVAALKRAKANLARYKAAVLKAAVEGRLVAQDAADEPAAALLERILAERRAKWEAEHPGKKYVEPKRPDVDGLPELPVGWVWATLEQLSWDSGYGTSEKCDYNASGPPVLRIPNIAGGYIDLSDLKFVINNKNSTLGKSRELAPNDLLIIRTNGSRNLIGRSAIIRHAFEAPHYFASYLIRFRIIKIDQISYWLSSIWDSEIVRRQIESIAATSAGQYNVSASSLSRLLIPIPPSTEQYRIAQELERHTSVLQTSEIGIYANLNRSERLRQGVLGKAFRGELRTNTIG